MVSRDARLYGVGEEGGCTPVKLEESFPAGEPNRALFGASKLAMSSVVILPIWLTDFSQLLGEFQLGNGVFAVLTHKGDQRRPAVPPTVALFVTRGVNGGRRCID